MTTHPHSFLRRLAPLCAMVLSAVPFCHAAVSHNLLSFTETNYTGYLIRSDGQNPAPSYNRDAIETRVAMEFTRSGVSDFNYDYRFDFQLLNESGTVQTLDLGGGSTGTTLAIWDNVDMTGGPGVIQRNIDARVKPAAQLNPGISYRVRVTVARRVAVPPGSIFSTGLTAQTALQFYKHFNQTVSGDAPRNVISEITSVSWTRPWRIRTDAARNSFRVQAVVRLTRYDDYAAPAPTSEGVGTRVSVVLRDDLNAVIPLEQSVFEFSQNVFSFVEGTPRNPATSSVLRTLDLRPTQQLASRSRTYHVQVNVGHYETAGDPLPFAGVGRASVVNTLLDFNGTLAFGGGSGTFTSIAEPGPAVGSMGTDHIVTSLRINNQSGSFQGLTFGNGSELPVKLFNDGVAHLSSGSLQLSGTGQPGVPGPIVYTLEGVSATPTGIIGTVRLLLPSGLGIAANAATRLHDPDILFPSTQLNPNLTPVAATVSNVTNGWAAEESKPFVFEYSAVSWDVAPGRIRFTTTGNASFVRAQAYNTLLNDNLVDPGQRVKLSNDGYYGQTLTVTTAEVLVTVDPGNGSALMTCDIAMGGSLFLAHHPHNALVSTSGGSQRIAADRVDPSYGGLTAGGNIRVGYRRDCKDADCGTPVGPENLLLTPEDSQIRFTRDGGLAASGTLTEPKTLNWGWISAANKFAHKAGEFTAAGFLASGICLPFSEQGGLGTPAEVQPARLLYTGVDPTAPDTVERPGSNAYKAGLGDYAGLNFRVLDWGDQDGELVLAGQSAPPFPLTNRCKYLVRASGVTGIHEAINGQFAPTAVIYGMDFEFTSLGWAFLSSEAVASRTDGNLTVPFPSDFGLEFEQIRISCNGGLLGAEIAPSDAGQMKLLAYWNADFRPFTMSFEATDENACDPSERRLVLGVEAWAGGIDQPLSGSIGFQTNGNLVTLASGDLPLPFDSRFRLPNNFDLAGPSGQAYRATPVGEAYLNDYAASPAGDGWMNVAARLDIPFFSDLEVHLHTTAVKDSPDALYQVMGGFPDKGFAVNGKHFFNEAVFDVSNRGFPQGVPLAQYREGLPAPNDLYRPVARKKWLNFIPLDYPLLWRSASRSFVSFTDKTNNFLVLTSEHRVDYLSPDFVEISFGGSVSTFPKLNLANFVADKATDVTAVLQQRLETHVVDAGVRGLNEILDVKQREFFEKALLPAVDATVDAVMAPITNNWNEAFKTWQNPNLPTVIDQGLLDPVDGVVAQVRTALSAAKNAVGVLQEVDARLAQAESALTTIEGFIEAKNGQPLGDLQATVIALAELVSQALDKPEFAEKINALMDRAVPRVEELRVVISEVRGFISEVRAAMGQAGDFAQQIIDMVDSNIASMEAAALKVRDDIEKILKEIKTGVDSLPQLESIIRQKIKQRIHDYMLGLPVIAEFNRLIKQRLYDVAALMTEAIDEVFDQINATLRDIIREVVGGLDDKFEEMLGDVGATMATASINGYAKIRNDSLTELRLDLKAQMSVPDEMKAHVFLVIKELSSENSPAECLPKSGKATEVTMGAKDIAVEWLFPDTTVSIQAKFLIDGDSEGLPLIGMGGGFDLKGEISFADSIVIHQLGASVMFSAQEAYLSAAAKLEVQGFSGGGGIFFGRTCSVDALFWDPTVQSVIGKPPFTGMYGYGEFWIPVPTLIGIPATCLFNLSAGVGAGAGFFIEGPTLFGKMFLGVSGDVLCLISITGEISLVGVARPSGLSLAGEGRFKAELGWCPVCIKVEKMIRLTRERGKWSHSTK
ncbi:MAG: hypothetical protein MUF04_00285 [Akkermansiaceae bacterium]|nr:hypothetical protein [Akkermansiaceae bacterium]